MSLIYLSSQLCFISW